MSEKTEKRLSKDAMRLVIETKFGTYDKAIDEIIRLRAVNARNKSKFEQMRVALRDSRNSTEPGLLDNLFDSIFGKRSK